MNITVTEFDNIFSAEYKEKSINFKEDPLVLSVSLKELMEHNFGAFYSLEDDRVLNNIKDDTRALAEQIRKYYGKKYFWTNLTNTRQISDFRGRVCYLLENRIHVCEGKDVGIYYKLPYFYEEDMVYDDFKKQYNTTDVPHLVRGGFQNKPVKSQLVLKYLKTTSSRQQKRNINRFWFTDNQYLYNIEVANDNPLLEMFKQLITEDTEITFDTNYNVDRIDQMYFYKLFNFTLVRK